MSVILDFLKTLCLTKQKEAKTLQNYMKKFRILREVLESHIGSPIIITKNFSTIKGCTENSTDKIEKLLATYQCTTKIEDRQ